MITRSCANRERLSVFSKRKEVIKINNKNIFYVYEWIRLDTNEPFYIGKGCNDRWRNLKRGKK